jgi:hypothetical protein
VYVHIGIPNFILFAYRSLSGKKKRRSQPSAAAQIYAFSTGYFLAAFATASIKLRP